MAMYQNFFYRKFATQFYSKVFSYSLILDLPVSLGRLKRLGRDVVKVVDI